MNETNYAPVKPNHSMAIVSLVLGILGLIGALPLIGPIGALIAGQSAKKDIQLHPEQYSGENFAQAGIVLGWIGIAVSVLMLAVVCLALLFFIPVSSISFPVQ